MPVGPDHIDAANDALAASFPAGAVVRLYTTVTDPNTGPAPADELTSDGGYAATELGAWAASVDGTATSEVDLGTSSDAFSDMATVWALTDPADASVIYWWDLLAEAVNVTAAGTDVVFGIDLYPNVGDL